MIIQTIDYIMLLPTTFWSPILAALIAVGGVAASNWSNTKRLKMQLEHDRNEKFNERIYQTRRASYSEVIDEFSRLNSYFGQIATLIREDKLDGNFMGDFLRAASKARLVAGREAMLKIGDIIQYYGEFALDINANILELKRISGQIDINKHYYELNDGHVKRILDERTKMNENLNFDEKKIEILDHNYKFFSDQRSDYAIKMSKYNVEYLNEIFVYQGVVIDKMTKAVDLTVDIMKYIRIDLGMEFDELNIRKQANEQVTKMSISLKNSMEYLTKKMNDIKYD